jgi:hypothetical protein
VKRIWKPLSKSLHHLVGYLFVNVIESPRKGAIYDFMRHMIDAIYNQNERGRPQNPQPFPKTPKEYHPQTGTKSGGRNISGTTR